MRHTLAFALLLLTLTACGGARKSSLENTQWKLQRAEGIPTRTIESEAERFTLRFEARTVSGRADCNLFFGDYTTDGSRIEFGQLGMTRMACPDMDSENRFAELLGAADRYEIRGNRLTLYASRRELAVFRSIAPDRPHRQESSLPTDEHSDR